MCNKTGKNQCCVVLWISKEPPVPVLQIFENWRTASSGCSNISGSLKKIRIQEPQVPVLWKKLRIKEPPVLVISKTLKHQQFSWKNQ
jgi:hypothetical protein